MVAPGSFACSRKSGFKQEGEANMPLTVESSGEIVAKIPRLPDGLYEPLRNPLYTVDELMKGWDSAKKS